MKKRDNRRFEEKFQDDLRAALLAIVAGTWSFIVRVGNAFKLIWRGLCWFVEETKPLIQPRKRQLGEKPNETAKEYRRFIGNILIQILWQKCFSYGLRQVVKEVVEEVKKQRLKRKPRRKD